MVQGYNKLDGRKVQETRQLSVEVVPNLAVLVRIVLVIEVVHSGFEHLVVEVGIRSFGPPRTVEAPVVALEHVEHHGEVPAGVGRLFQFRLVRFVHGLHLCVCPIRSVVLLACLVGEVHLTYLPAAEVFVEVRPVHQCVHLLHEVPVVVGVGFFHRLEGIAHHACGVPHHGFAFALAVFLYEVIDTHSHNRLVLEVVTCRNWGTEPSLPTVCFA